MIKVMMMSLKILLLKEMLLLFGLYLILESSGQMLDQYCGVMDLVIHVTQQTS